MGLKERKNEVKPDSDSLFQIVYLTPHWGRGSEG